MLGDEDPIRVCRLETPRRLIIESTATPSILRSMRGALLYLSSYCLRTGFHRLLRQTFNSVIKLGFHSLFGELEGVFIHGVRLSSKIRGVMLPE